MSGRSKFVRSYALAAIISLGAYSMARADALIGTWDNTSGDGWIDWGSLKAINPPATDTSVNGNNIRARYQFVTANETVTGSNGPLTVPSSIITNGTGALMVVPGRTTANSAGSTGFNQNLSIKLENQPNGAALMQEFLHDNFFSIDISAQPDSVSTGGIEQLYELSIFDDFGSTADQPNPEITVLPSGVQQQAFNGANKPTFGYPNGNWQTYRLTWNIDQIAADFAANGEATPSFIELVLATNSDSTVHNTYFFDNAQLTVNDPSPEPASLGLFAATAGLLLRRRR